MCNLWQSGAESKELTVEQIGEIADILKSLGIVGISLSGGEPFVRKDLIEIVRVFTDRGFVVGLLTNGILSTETQIKELAQAGLREVSISLHSLNPKKQAYIYNSNEDVLKKIIKSLCLFSEILPKNGRLLLINSMVSHLNINELLKLMRFSEKMGYYISFIPFEPKRTRENGFRMIDSDYNLVDKVYGELIGLKKKRNYIFNSTAFLEQSREYLKTGKSYWQCDAGRLYFSINPEGNISICHKFNLENATTYRQFTDYFRSQEYEAARKRLIKDCDGCLRPCWAEVTNLIRDRKTLLELAASRIFNQRRRAPLSYIEALKWENPF